MKTLITALAIAALATPAAALGPADRQDRRDARQEERRETRHDQIIPGSCLVPYDTRAGASALYDAECLRAGHIEVAELPSDCLTHLRADGQRVHAYDPACLAAQGYHLPG